MTAIRRAEIEAVLLEGGWGVTQDSEAGKCATILYSMLAAFTASVGVLQPQAYRKRPRPLLAGVSMGVLLFITKQWFSVQWVLSTSFILLAPLHLLC